MSLSNELSMSLNKQQALDIINREPTGGAGFYSTHTKKFYITVLGNWFVFASSWTKCHLPAVTRAEMIALNIKHKDRINSYVDVDDDIDQKVFQEELERTESRMDSEAIEGELMDDEPDIGFGEDDTDEFGGVK